jgi:hypothetical protein
MTASFSKGLFARRQFANNASRRRQPHLKLAAGRLGVAQRRLGARKRVAVFEPGRGRISKLPLTDYSSIAVNRGK